MTEKASDQSDLPVYVTRERTVYTYTHLWHAAGCMLENGEREPCRSSWQFMSSLILTAFAFEAYLNHVGEQGSKSWENLPLGPREKLDLLCERFAHPLLERGKRPYQTLDKLVDFRNDLAHGRTEVLPIEKVEHRTSNYDERLALRPMASWERMIQSPAFARQARTDIEMIIRSLHESRPDPKDQLFTFDKAINHATITPPAGA